MVSTDKGKIKIEDIKVGDKVLSYNENTKNAEYKEVKKHYKNLHKSSSYNHFLKIEMENGKILECTPNHKIYTNNRGYTRADGLTEDDDIVVS